MSELPARERRLIPAESSEMYTYGDADGEPQVPGLSIGSIFGILRRYALLILLIAGVVFALAWWLVPESTPTYQANAVVRLTDPGRFLTGGLAAAGTENMMAPDFMISQLHVVQSRAIVGEVVDLEGLRLQPVGLFPARLLRGVRVDPAAFADTLHVEFKHDGFSVRSQSGTVAGEYGELVTIDGATFTISTAPGELEPASLVVWSREQAVEWLLGALHISVRKATNIIDIAYADPNPLRAQRVVNAVAESFRSHSTESVRRKAQSRREFIEEQRARTESDLMEAQLALSSFQTREGLYSSSDKLAAEQTGLMSLELRMEELNADRRLVEQLLESVEQAPPNEFEDRLQTLAAASGIASSPVVGRLYDQLADYRSEREGLVSGSFGLSESNPEVERLTVLISSTQRHLVNAVRSHIASLEARIASLNDLRERSTTAIRGLPQVQAEETRLKQNVATISRMADLLRDEYQRAMIAEAVEVGNVEILDVASSAMAASQRSRPLMLALSVILGVGVGGGCAVLLESRNTSVRRREELEELLRVPGLAVIPWCSANPPAARLTDRGSMRWRIGAGSRSNGADRDEMSNHYSKGAEAFRTLRNNLIFSHTPESLKLLVVTSPSSGDGKTTTAANLASILARQGMRVLLVDCDLRRPQLHNLFDVPREPGFVDLVLGRSGIEQVARPTSIDGLFVIPRGAPYDDEAEMLGGDRVRSLLRTVSLQFDMVIMDSPPLLATSDAASLGAIADGVLLVIRAGKTDRGAAQHALLQLAMVGARVVGSVLNDPEAVVPRYGGSYYQETYSVVEA